MFGVARDACGQYGYRIYWSGKNEAMLWGREKTVRVELVNPQIRLQAENTPPPVPSPAAVDAGLRTDTDFAFKLIGSGAIVLQSALLIHGYSVLAGQYDAFGIAINELEIGLPSLMFNGYVFLLTDLYKTANRVPLFGPGALLLVFILLAAAFVWPIMRAAKRDRKVGTSVLLGFALFFVFSLPMLGVLKGSSLAQALLQQATGIKSSSLPRVEHLITTDQGEQKRGTIIVASEKYTFLLIGTEVLKIDNDGNKVVRVTRLLTEAAGGKSQEAR